MVPLNAPFPTAWYFPFQFDTGIQISIVISESDDGRSVAATRQVSGRGFDAGGILTPGSSATRETFANLIVVEGSFNDVRLSQESAAASGTAMRTLTKNHATRAQTTPAEMRVIQRLVMCSSSCDYFARTGCPGTIPSTSCPFATTGTPLTMTC